jgi:hypothetical protein
MKPRSTGACSADTRRELPFPGALSSKEEGPSAPPPPPHGGHHKTTRASSHENHDVRYARCEQDSLPPYDV